MTRKEQYRRRNITMAELDAIEAEQRLKLPKWWDAASPKVRRAERVKEVVRVVRGRRKP